MRHIMCRSCGSEELESILELGVFPLANALREESVLGHAESCFPLELSFCPRCALVQITESVSPEVLFREYPYFSSFSDTVVANAGDIAQRLVHSHQLSAKSLVIEAASNDGYLLQHYQAAGIPVLGIEPAENIAAFARNDKGIPTISSFFDKDLARSLAADGHSADVFHANNVLAHVPDLNGFLQGVTTILKPTGIAVVEVPYVRDMIEKCEFDTIYHEHLCYFSVTSLGFAFRRCGLTIFDVECLPIHGGSLRVFAALDRNAAATDTLRRVLTNEAHAGMHHRDFYLAFANRAADVREKLQQLLKDLRRDGKRVAAYGASAKGSTLLSYCGIGNDLLDFVVDRSPHKQGRYMPGVPLPIVPPSTLLEEMPDYVLLLAWNFIDEIRAQQAEYLHRGGRFILPVPSPLVLQA